MKPKYPWLWTSPDFNATFWKSYPFTLHDASSNEILASKWYHSSEFNTY